MIVKNWSFSYSGNPYPSTLNLARDIIPLLSLGVWPDSYKQEFYDKLQLEVNSVIDWTEIIIGVKDNLQEHVCFEPIT